MRVKSFMHTHPLLPRIAPSSFAGLAAIAGMLLLLPFAGLPAAAEHAVFKSTDRGRSWARADAGIPGGPRINAFGSLGETLFAGTNEGIFLSRDEARSWQPASGLAMSSGRILSFAGLGKRVFAGTDSGLLVSADGGKSWARDATFPDLKVRSLLAHQEKVYAGTEADGVFASSGDGKAWLPLGTGLPERAQVFVMAASGGRVFAGLYSKGLYVWNEQERRWTKSGPVFPLALAATAGHLFAGHNPGGLHWSADVGVSWSRGTGDAELQGPAPVWEMAASEELVIAGSGGGIYYSEDRGRTWTRARTGLPAESPGIAFLLKPTFVLAGTSIEAAERAPGATPAASGP